MASKLNVYNLGEKGVNVTVSPIHLEDGELTSGQNAVYDPKGEEGGLRQRDGMTKLNSTAAAGAIKGFISLPLPDPNNLTKTLWLGMGTYEATDRQWYAVTWAPELGLFAAVAASGTGNRVATSPDGISWTTRTSAADNEWRGLCWSPELSLFVAVSQTATPLSTSDNRVMTSPDGIVWTSQSSPAGARNSWQSVAWSASLSLFVAVASSGSHSTKFVMTSPDGIVWTERTVDSRSWNDVIWVSELGLFVAVSQSADAAKQNVLTSPNGITWTLRTLTVGTQVALNAVVWSPARALLVAVPKITSPMYVFTSADGLTWASRTVAANLEWESVAWSPELELFAAVASSGTANRVMTSPDGITWTTRVSDSDISWRGIAWSPAENIFAAVASDGTIERVMTSTDGITWIGRSSIGYTSASSTDGTTWTDVNTLGNPMQNDKLPSGNLYFQRALTFQRKLYYPSDDYVLSPTAGHTAPPLRVFDGSVDREIVRIPYNPTSGAGTNSLCILDLCVHNGQVIISVYDSGGTGPNHRGRVFALEPSTGQLTQVGNSFGSGTGEAAGGMPMALCSYGGQLWAGTYGVTAAGSGLIYSIYAGVSQTWTLDHTTAAGQGYVTSMANYKGDLYVATMADAASAALLLKRSTLGVWTTSDTLTSAAAAAHYYASLIVFEGNLYAGYYDSGAGGTTLIRKFDGTSWTTAVTVGATYAWKQVGAAYIWKGDLYMTFVASGATISAADGFVLKLTSGTSSWSRVLNNANIRSYIGSVSVEA